MSTGIKETREAIEALKSLTVRTVKALADDGKIGIGEGVGFMVDIVTIIDGLKGSGQILAELRDLDYDERQVLRDDIHAAIVAAGLTHRQADLADHALEWIDDTVKFALKVKNQPRSAVAV